MAKRYNINVNDALAAAIEARAAEELADPNDWIRQALGAHVAGRCAGNAGVTASGLPVAPKAAAAEDAPARGKGRPLGGNVQAEATIKVLQTGDIEAVKAALIACGYFPPGCEGPHIDYDTGRPIHGNVMLYEIKRDEKGELVYTQRIRYPNVEDTYSRVVWTTTNEIVNDLKRGGHI